MVTSTTDKYDVVYPLVAHNPFDLVQEEETNLRVRVIVITPTVAKRWLEHNLNLENLQNRRISKLRVDKYANDMLKGNWRLNGESIVFDTEGWLVDGQQRLTACIQAGVPFRSLVVMGVPTESFITMDSGAPRNFTNVLETLGKGRESKEYAAIARSFLQYNLCGNFAVSLFGKASLSTNSELLDLYNNKHEIIELAAASTKPVMDKIGGSSGVYGTLWIILGQIDQSDRDYFFSRLPLASLYEEGDPVKTLQETIIADRRGMHGVPPNILGSHVIKAWNAYRSGTQIFNKIRYSASKPYPVPI